MNRNDLAAQAMPVGRLNNLATRAALRATRAAAGLTQDAMAARIGISRVTYVRLERGYLTEPNIHIEKIIQLAGLGTEGWWSLLGTAYRIHDNLKRGNENARNHPTPDQDRRA